MMRQGGPNKRSRGRGGNNNNNGGGNGGGGRRPNVPNRMQTFDSNGPDIRIRGNAYQVHEKYLTLANDASAAGDRIVAENYYQHAEHYYRIINAQEYGPDGQRRPRPEGYNNQGQGDQPSLAQGEGPQPDFNRREGEGNQPAQGQPRDQSYNRHSQGPSRDQEQNPSHAAPQGADDFGEDQNDQKGDQDGRDNEFEDMEDQQPA